MNLIIFHKKNIVPDFDYRSNNVIKKIELAKK